MIQRIKQIMFYAGLTKEEYAGIEDELMRANARRLKTYSAVGVFFLAVMFLMSFFVGEIGQNKWVYFVTFLVALLIFVLTVVEDEISRFATWWFTYFFLGIMFIFGLMVGLPHPDQVSTSFMVALVVSPLLYYDRPIRINSFILCFVVISVVLSYNFEIGSAKTLDIVNSIIYGLLSCVINTGMLMIKLERLNLEKKNKLYAETDVLTGLKNRNCYENRLYEYKKENGETITCIYVDANGLHELNNAKGHKAGDVMLQTIAGFLQDSYGKDNTYRIGGDEFVSMLVDWNKADVDRKMKAIIKKSNELGYHISVGIVQEKIATLDIDELIKNTEEIMYQAKKEYYSQKGNDRRMR